MAAKPVESDPRLERFISLRWWFESIGCCSNCKDELAWTQIHREDALDPSKVIADLSDCRNLDKGERCRARANANRKAMPVRP
jgi:hypothetical protein